MDQRTPGTMALAPSSLERLMIVLAIDTTVWTCSVALWENGQELAFQEVSSEKDQAAILPQLVQKVLGKALPDQVLVNLGPGSFTGIRVGLAFAKGLTMGLNIPLKGMDSFLTTFLCLNNPKDVLILIEAHRKDVFGRRFIQCNPEPPQSLIHEDIEKILKSPFPPAFAGSGLHPILDDLDYKEIVTPWRGAQQLACAYFNNPDKALEAKPFYMREAAVTLSQKT